MSLWLGRRHDGTAERGQTRPVDRARPAGVRCRSIRTPGDRINEMDSFCRERGFKVATRGIGKLRRTRDYWDAMRWCFADPEHADEFQKRFGGERMTIKARRSGVRS
jgi:hypothetical protein